MATAAQPKDPLDDYIKQRMEAGAKRRMADRPVVVADPQAALERALGGVPTLQEPKASHRRPYIKAFVALFPKPLVQTLKLGVEGLSRAQTSFRQGILWAGKRITTDEFKARYKASLAGDYKQSNDEFSKLLVGEATWNKMERTPFIPGWFKAAMEPEIALAKHQGLRVEREPRVSVADAFSFGTDFWADPSAVLTITPAGLGRNLTANAAGKMATAPRPFRMGTKALDSLFGSGGLG